MQDGADWYGPFRYWQSEIDPKVEEEQEGSLNSTAGTLAGGLEALGIRVGDSC